MILKTSSQELSMEQNTIVPVNGSQRHLPDEFNPTSNSSMSIPSSPKTLVDLNQTPYDPFSKVDEEALLLEQKAIVEAEQKAIREAQEKASLARLESNRKAAEMKAKLMEEAKCHALEQAKKAKAEKDLRDAQLANAIVEEAKENEKALNPPPPGNESFNGDNRSNSVPTDVTASSVSSFAMDMESSKEQVINIYLMRS